MTSTPAAAPVETVDAIVLDGTAETDFSLFGLFMQADIIVKMVMVLLVFASFWSWSIIFSKRQALKKINDKADLFDEAFWSGEPLDKLYARVKKNNTDPMLVTFTSGMEEWQSGMAGGLPETASMQASLMQRVERTMALTIGKEVQRLEQGMTFLASVGSSAPFIGLFGTVWGIMNSFADIATRGNTNLVTVAPGIAEALFATALGLVAAIPAVLAYNVLSTIINRYAERMDAFMTEFHAILSRHMDQQFTERKKKSRRTQLGAKKPTDSEEEAG